MHGRQHPESVAISMMALRIFGSLSLALLMLVACTGGSADSPAMGTETPPGAADVEHPDIDMLVADQITYRVQERLSVTNYGPGRPEKHNVWIAMITDSPSGTGSICPPDARVIAGRLLAREVQLG